MALLQILALSLAVVPACGPAQETVTLSAADFQRLVYSAHLHTQLAEKPELEASLQALLELQRRNPQADGATLAGVSSNALQYYRTYTPAYIRTNGFRDEILAAYLNALRQVSEGANVVPASLALLNNFMLGEADYNSGVAPPATLIVTLADSGNQRLFHSEGEAIKRQTLLDDCVGRAQGNAAFAAAMDRLLSPEIHVSLGDTPAEIINNTNSPLHDNLTMETLLTCSDASGRLTISSNLLTMLFTNETQTLWDSIHTNLALEAQINQSQPDFLAYLTNQAAIDANVQLVTAVKQGQAAKIASATAAMLVHSKLVEAAPNHFEVPALVGEIQATAGAMSSLAKGLNILTSDNAEGITKVMACGDVASAGLQVLNLLSGTESPDDKIVRELGNIQTLLGDLSTNMNYRFDRVDQSLTTIFDTLNQQFTNIVIIEGKIDHIAASLNDIRSRLVDVQSSLNRLEQEIQLGFQTSERDAYLVTPANAALFYEIQNRGRTMSANEFFTDPNYENDFYSYAVSVALNANFSPNTFGSEVMNISALNQQLALRPLGANLNYLKLYLDTVLHQTTQGSRPFANPQDWFMGAYAYLQLAVENPTFFRQKSGRITGIIAAGQNLTNFFGSLTFNGARTNSALFKALEDTLATNLISFDIQVSNTEFAYATQTNFALGTWRQWDAAAPRVTGTNSTVAGTYPIPSLSPVKAIAAGRSSCGLAIRTNGTVVGWGANDFGQVTIPADLTNVVAVAEGGQHTLALKANGTVVGWGDNSMGQTTSPPSAANARAIASGEYHNLALKADGTVVGWGYNYDGEATGQPNLVSPSVSTGLVSVAGVTLTSVAAIAAGGYHSLAVRSNGTVVAWGQNSRSQTNIPAGLNGVMAIAAGYTHSLALRTNGTVVGWGANNYGQTNTPAGLTNVVAIAAGDEFSLALKADGTVVGWGHNDYGQTNIPAGLSNVVAIAAGDYFGLALKADFTVVGWGRHYSATAIPGGLTNVVAVDAGCDFSLALKADSTVVGWGQSNYSTTNMPAGLTNVVAVAAGYQHSLVLKADGTVVGWGYNRHGEATGVANTVSPYISSGPVSVGGQVLTNVVSIVADHSQYAGEYGHSLALKADGTVVAWGYNDFGQTTVPVGLNNVVAVAAGVTFSLALKADGTVVGWGGSVGGTVPAGLSNVVAIAAGNYHSLALKADGTVVCWGNSDYGATSIPAGLSNTVAIATGNYHSLALKADGTVVAWGRNDYGATNVPISLTNVVAIAAGQYHSLFLTAPDSGGPAGSNTLSFLRATVPGRVGALLQSCNQHSIDALSPTGTLYGAGIQLSGAKALMKAVLELGMPYTLERDDVLHGFLYGSESLVDLETAVTFFQKENVELQTTANPPPQALTQVAALRYQRFQDRLNAHLAELRQPEIPRLVDHTLRLLYQLDEAWESVPPPALELSRQGNSLCLLLYGEPYARYTLLYRDTLSPGGSGWNTNITNLESDQPATNLPPISAGAQRFYRAKLPLP